jgi:holo-[acyl-carrier protein] synthase
VDLVEVERIADLIARHPRALTRLFVPSEVSDAGQGAVRIQRLAARFALKEAVYKALGGTGTLPWREIQYVRKPGLPAWVHLEGRARHMADRLGVDGILASVSHVRGTAVASATAFGRCPQCGS